MAQAVVAGVFKVLINVAISVVIAKVQKALQKKPTRVLQKIDVSYSGALEPRRRLYGYFRAGGLDTMPATTSGATGDHLHKCLTISDGEIQAVDAVWFNNDRLAAADFGSSFVGGLSVGSGPYAGHALISAHLGTGSQPADTWALGIAPGWTDYHRGDGVAYVYFWFKASNEKWPQGAPNVVVEGRGAKIYDPRLDVSPGASPTNPSYIAFTTNPALILADFLQWGGEESASLLIWSEVVTAANICDESVTVPNGAGGTTTQPRYTCSIEVYAPQNQRERDDTIAMLARAMLGSCWYNTKWHMRAGAYTSPAGFIVDDDFLDDPWEIDTAQPRASGGLFNKLSGAFVDQSANSQPLEYPEVSSTTYATEDGESIRSDAEFRTARNVYEAQRNAILLLRQTRNRTIVAATCRFRVAKFNLYDIVTVTNSKVGWVAQTARITRMKHHQTFKVEVQLQKIASSDFTDPSTSDYTVPGAITTPSSTPYAPDAPRNLTASSQPNGIIFTWDAPLIAPPGLLYKLYEYSSSTPFSSATQVGPTTPQTSLVLARSDTTVRYYWVVAVLPDTLVAGTQAPPSNGVPGSAQSASSALSAIVYPGSATVDGYTSTLTTPAVAVTPSGGTAPYTYATTFTSGGSGISILNGTTTAPSFQSTGLAEGDVKTGTARIRVTDNVAATYDVYVAVTVSRLYGVTLNNATVASHGGLTTSAAVSTFVVGSDGNIYPQPGTSYRWLNPAASAADYDVKFVLLSGTLNSGTTGTKQQLSSSRAVVGVRTPGSGVGTSTQTLTVEIYLHNSPFTLIASAALTLTETIS